MGTVTKKTPGYYVRQTTAVFLVFICKTRCQYSKTRVSVCMCFLLCQLLSLLHPAVVVRPIMVRLTLLWPKVKCVIVCRCISVPFLASTVNISCYIGVVARGAGCPGYKIFFKNYRIYNHSTTGTT